MKQSFLGETHCEGPCVPSIRGQSLGLSLLCELRRAALANSLMMSGLNNIRYYPAGLEVRRPT